jgi:hypothetical protein
VSGPDPKSNFAGTGKIDHPCMTGYFVNSSLILFPESIKKIDQHRKNGYRIIF